MTLFAHVLGQVVEAASGFAAARAAFSAAEGLVARPGTGCRARGTIYIQYTRFDVATFIKITSNLF